MRLRRIPTLCAVALLATSALVAFGPSDVGVAAAPKPIVTIGVIAPVDGGLTSFGQGIRDSVQLAVQQATKKKAVPGWTIKVKVLDDSSDPTKGTQAAAAMVADKSVVAVVGPYNSGVAAAALPTLAQGGLALVSPSNTLTSLTLGADFTKPVRPYDNYFRLVGADSAQAVFLADEARKLGYSKAAVVSETKAVSSGLADQFAAAFTKAGGTVTVRQTVPDGADNFTSFITAAAPTSPGLLFFGGEYNVAATLHTQATAAGLTMPLMGGDGMNDPAFISGAGAASAGSYASGVGVPVAQLPGAAKFIADYKAAGFTTQPSDYGPYAYDAANAVIATLEKTLKGKQSLPSGVRKQVVRGLQGTKQQGVTGAIQFDQYGDIIGAGFTLYQVAGSPLAWTPVAKSGTTATK
jgi:branched-chain amino acid transport system substrate-binding protein